MPSQIASALFQAQVAEQEIFVVKLENHNLRFIIVFRSLNVEKFVVVFFECARIGEFWK